MLQRRRQTREGMNRSGTRLEVRGYQVVEYLGSGARSTIWRVRERRTNRFCALKRVTKQPGDDNRFLGQAINEFEVASRLEHSSIRQCYSMRRVRKRFRLLELHLLMELCEGSSCQANRPTGLAKVVNIFHAVAEALAHVHARGYIHADMKPNNIIVADNGTVKIIDFGQSCPIGTVKERIQGTPDFIAPEQVHCRPLDVRTDVFNFGATLYWTVTGQPIPTVLPRRSDGIQLVTDMQVVPPAELNPEVSPGLARLVLDCIEPELSRRLGSMRDVIARLDLVAHTLDRAGAAKSE